MNKIIIAGFILAAITACAKNGPEATSLVDTGKEDPVADFDYTVDSKNGVVSFINKSTDAIAYRWTFGDAGNNVSIQENPTFIYRSSGSYTVTLRASNGYTTNVRKKIIEYSLPDDVIMISPDGKIDDWSRIPWRDDINLWGTFTGIKTATTSSTLYVLLEGTDALSSGHWDISFDLDNNPDTGNAETDYLVKGGKGADLFLEDQAIFLYRSDGTQEYDWIEGLWPEESDPVTIDGKVYKEWKFNMNTGWAYVDKPSETVLMAIWFRDGNWIESGATMQPGNWAPFAVTMGQYREVSDL